MKKQRYGFYLQLPKYQDDSGLTNGFDYAEQYRGEPLYRSSNSSYTYMAMQEDTDEDLDDDD
jgi:hypothetical protein